MADTRKKRSAGKLMIMLALFAALVLLCAFLMFSRMVQSVPEPGPAAQELAAAALEAARGKLPPAQEDGALIRAGAEEALVLSLDGTEKINALKAEATVSLRTLDLEETFAAMQDRVNAALYELVDSAKSRAEVFDEDGTYTGAVMNSAFKTALAACLAEPQYATVQSRATLKYGKGGWQMQDAEGFENELAGLIMPKDAGTYADELYSACESGAELYSLRFRIDETAVKAPVPSPDRFGSTDDPNLVQALLETAEAKKLIGDEELVWNSSIERIPGTQIRYYLDETILTIVWQEVANRGVGTFAEVFVADGSQLRRKIDGDAFGSMEFLTTSQYARETNAVLALGGDFYNHDRACGIVVYQRQVYRFEPDSCDTCFITSEGDMLFAYRGQFRSREEAQAFVDENDVLFSLCFGPVLIDNGEDVTPNQYRWGEIQDEYARSALGMFGKGHYLTMNMNCQLPNYYYLSTLRAAADEMIKRGCQKAYTLDGGQTATTVFNYELINPVQFGWEKIISDIIYFATALPEDR